MRQAERYEILEQLNQEQFNREEFEIARQLFIRKVVGKILMIPSNITKSFRAYKIKKAPQHIIKNIKY